MTSRAEIPGFLPCAAAAVAVWVVAARVAATWPLDVHLRDDAYYYFAWARSVLAGQGPCVSEGVPTSGIHVAWALVLVLCGAVCGALALPAASVWLGLALHAGTAALLLRFGGGWRRGLLAAAACAGSPFLAAEATNGQETALACFALALLLVVWRRGVRWFFAAALLAVAARSDLVLFVAVLALAEPSHRASRIAATALVLACYAAWNLLLAGHPMQDSAAPIPWLLAEGAAADGVPAGERLWPHARSLLLGVPFRLSSTPLFCAWLIAAVIGLRRRDPSFAWLLLGGVLLASLHHLWRVYPRDYYFAPLGVAGGFALLRLLRDLPRLGLLLAVLAVVWNVRHAVTPRPELAGQRELTLAGRFLGELLPEGEAVGCFNAGLVTWEHRGRVVNLDGVVNRPAFRALQRGDLAGYLDAQGVAYLVDNPVQFARRGVHASGRHFAADFCAADHLEEVARFVWPERERSGDREGTAWVSLYRRRGLGQEPRASPGIRDLGAMPDGRAIVWRAAEGAVLRADRELFRAPGTLVYVLQVPQTGRLSADGEPVLEIRGR